jgi:hypothetical protein
MSGVDDQISAGVAAFFLTGALLGLAYLGFLGFVHRFARTPSQYLLGLALVLVSAPIVGIIAFRILPDIIARLV